MISIRIAHGERVAMFDGIDRNTDWTGAACIGHDPTIWFPPPGAGEYERARHICERCPIRERCLEVAMDWEARRGTKSRYGMFGGLTPDERSRLARERRASK